MELIHPNRSLLWGDIIYAIQEILAGTPEVYLVGGMVRDAYRDYPFKDIDLTCGGDGRAIARKIADALHGSFYPLDDERGIGRAIVQYHGDEYVMDVAAFQGDDLLADLQGRDFTVNAMAVPLDSDLMGIYDPLDGIKDWHDKVLRRCTPDSIYNDPIRALRAIRMSVALGLTIEPETRHDVRKYGSFMVETSAERTRDEFFKLIGGKRPQAGILALDTLGLLKLVIPEVEQIPREQWRHVLQSVEKLSGLLQVISYQRDDNIAANLEFGTFVYLLDRFRGWLQTQLAITYPDKRTHRMLLTCAALMRYVGDSDEHSAQLAATRGVDLKLSNDEVKRLREVIRFVSLPLSLHEQTSIEAQDVYHFWRETGDAGVDACLLAAVDYLVSHGFNLDSPAWTAFLHTIRQLFEGYETAMMATPIINGDDLMAAFNLKPSPQIGELLEALREAAALGEISTREDAFHLAEELLQ